MVWCPACRERGRLARLTPITKEEVARAPVRRVERDPDGRRHNHSDDRARLIWSCVRGHLYDVSARIRCWCEGREPCRERAGPR